MTDAEKIYVRFRGRTLGPLTPQKVHDLIRRGQITRMHELSGDGLSWSKAEEFGDFFSTSPAATASSVGMATNPEDLLGGDLSATTESSVNPEVAAEPTVEWYAHVDGDNQGPVSLARIQQWKESGHVRADTLVWRSGLDSWQPAEQAIPELFGTQHSIPDGFGDGAFVSTHQTGAAGAKDLSVVAMEMDRRRGWAFFFGVALIVLSSFQMIGQIVTVFVAASGSAAGVNTVPALVGAIVGIAFAGTVMAAGILLLQYCSQVKEFALRPNRSSGLSAAKRLNAVWAFVGIACLIWLVILLSILLVLVSIGLSVVDAFS